MNKNNVLANSLEAIRAVNSKMEELQKQPFIQNAVSDKRIRLMAKSKQVNAVAVPKADFYPEPEYTTSPRFIYNMNENSAEESDGRGR